MGDVDYARSRWNLDIRPALVARFVAAKAELGSLDVPVAFSEAVYVPERHRSLYEQLNSRLALNVVIQDEPAVLLVQRLRRYVLGHSYCIRKPRFVS